MTEMIVKLTSIERDALRKLARLNGRHPRDQARIMLREALMDEPMPVVPVKSSDERPEVQPCAT